jgi:Ca-activated chloride channel family protein
VKGSWIVLTLLASAPAALAQKDPALPQPPVFAVQVESVLIDAFATNNGKNIAGLKASDIILTDNGEPRTFDLLSADSLPVRAILVFDTSASMQGEKLERLRAAASSFLAQLRPQDEVALISFADEIDLRAPLSPDRSRAEFGLLSLRAQGATSIYDALFAALVSPRSSLRTLVILFSDGEDNMSWLGEKEAKAMVERSNALIHVVAARAADSEFANGRSSRASSETNYLKTLRGFATITGGSLIEVNSPGSIEAAFAQILQQMKDRYVLRYTPTTDPAPGWHALDLRLRSGKGKVRGRTGYWVEGR